METTAITGRSGLTAAMSALAATDAPPPTDKAAGPASPPLAPSWMALLGRSERGARDQVPKIEGRIPDGLSGSLYRNGPGLFERGGQRKPHLLDGDGLVQRLSFLDGRVRYQNHFVQTAKLKEEEARGRFRYATWSARKPGGMLANIGTTSASSQAGVTIYPFRDGLYAFDEVSPPYRIDPDTLATLGEAPLGNPTETFDIKAHTKLDPVTGEWLLAGVTHGRTMKVHAITYAASGALASHQVVESPRQVYLHDFFVTENYFVFVLQPLWISAWKILAGLSSYMESMRWNGADGNLVLVLPRRSGAPRFLEAPGAYMWHALNAYEDKDEIIADFIGYDAPDHFVPQGALLYEVMRGRVGLSGPSGTLRRYRMNIRTATLRAELLADGVHEFPTIDPRVATRPHRVGYCASGGLPLFHHAITRFDVESGNTTHCEFGRTTVVGEPIFAAKPGGAPDEGWLIVQGVDGGAERAFFAVLNAMAVDDGPLAKIWLPYPLPISFHGAWIAT